VYTAVKVAEQEHTQAQLFDESALVSDFNDITDADLVFQEEKEAGDEIANQILGAEADCQPADAGRRQQRRDVDPYLLQQEHRGDDEENGGGGGLDDLTQRLGALLAL
jgi:hypothetical protein